MLKRFVRGAILPLLMLLFIMGGMAKILIADTSEAPSTRPASLEELIQRAAEFAQAAADFQARSEAIVGERAKQLSERAMRYRLLEGATERLVTAIQKAERLQTELAGLQKILSTPLEVGQDTASTFTLSAHDAILGEQETLLQRRENLGLELEIAKTAVPLALTDLEKAARDLRLKREAQTTASKAVAAQALWALDSGELEVQRLETEVLFKRQEVANLEAELQIVEKRASHEKRRHESVRQRLRFDQTDLDRQLGQINQRKDDYEKRHLETMAALKRADTDWQAARQRLDSAVDERQRIEAEAYLSQRDAERRALQVHLEHMEKTILLLNRQQQIWQQRYALISSRPDSAQLQAWRSTARSQIEGLQKLAIIEQRRQAELQQQISRLESRQQEENLLPGVKMALTTQLNVLFSLSTQRNAFSSVLSGTQILENRLLEEVEALEDQVPIAERLVQVANTWRSLWNFEVWQIDGQPVTVGKLIFALLIFIIGMILAKFFLSQFQRRFLSQSQLKSTTASTIHKVLSYTTYLLVLLLALRIVNIPLAAFAFLGGAVAIGVGFGAQNLINNFISGFIIMGEQPITIGDLIEVDGVIGQVEEVGARCTRVRTGENIHILVPNSSFLEKNITNWTLADHKIRARVVVGVAYGSPVDRVEALLLEAARANPGIIQEPAPFVLFTDFGDNALGFEIHFWITVQRVIERRLVESSMRFAIDRLFRQADITIAFPQRDVHLDAAAPIEVHLTDRPPSS